MTPPRRSRPTSTPRKRQVAGTRKRPDPRPEPLVEDTVVEEEVVAPPVIDSAPEPRAKQAEPDPEPEPEPEDEPEAVAQERPWWQLPALLTAVAVLFAALAVWFATQTANERAESGVDNRALVDTGVTTEVTGQISTATQSLFSLDYADMGKSERLAKDVLVGKAVEQYQVLMAEIRKIAPERKIVLTTTIRQIGVKSIEGDRALVLVFADHHTLRQVDDYREDVPVQVTLTTERVDGRWRISDIVLR
ncbi:hypothetical protein NLX83_06505 [Allokutzneria sp. A3M-2-11 16]|uniref:hypothetical protein n=1 Tax=Allokutzneria sp. A3M-2-11 16 TaxID=2962043 RepID=UPI0020B799C5|nr:hypothetical protein [Allokutzneria sp. A3M-2-11 16]MCP3798905.1 hypothetical protein [Allokutzneria sp. A3M-2-11 16]